MKTTIVVGMQWGDEGKGKIIDYLSKKNDYIMRCAGGNNAGHTIHIKNKKYVLSLLPSGILQKNTICILSSGMVIDFRTFHDEFMKISKDVKNINERLKISHLAHLILPYHIQLEIIKTTNIIGTTKKGIGPAYEDKIARRGIRICDLNNFESLKEKLFLNINYWNFCLNIDDINSYIDKLLQDLKTFNNMYKHLFQNIDYMLDEQIDVTKKNRFLLEGAQGTMLDIDYGTYPYVTSSNTTAAGCLQGSGISPMTVKNIVGISKAYTTRVGNGPFPTEMIDELSNILREYGNEYGSVTGRPRRIGWLDLVALGRTARLNGVTELAITKLDTMSCLESIKICSEYDKLTNEPIYEEMDNWFGFDFKNKKYSDLPNAVKRYFRSIEVATECHIKYIGVGPNRNDLIVVKKGEK